MQSIMSVIAVLLIVAPLVAPSLQACSAGKQIMKSGGLSDGEKQAIVDSHNRLRQSVALGQVTSQPPAANMMEMKWDNELAMRAQQWADNCVTAHDLASQRDVGRFPVGQNIAATWTTRPPSDPVDSMPDFNKQINAWFDEVRLYGFKPTGYGHGTGHYSQLVWGETSHVGCGFSFYYDPTRGYTKLYVCNYGPGGNVIGYKPYEKGQPSCSSYGLSDSRKYSGLCASSYETTSYNEVTYDQNDYKYPGYTQEEYQWPIPYQKQQPTQQSFKPFISLFENTAGAIGNSAHKFIQNAFQTKRGFRFGTLYL